jgi:hypothetical protein
MRGFQFMRLEGIPRQVPGPGEVLVAVKAAGAGRGTGWSAIGLPRAAAAAGRQSRLSGAEGFPPTFRRHQDWLLNNWNDLEFWVE